MPVAEECVAVGDAFVRAACDPENRFTSPDMLQREGQPVDRDSVARRNEPLRLLGVPVGIGPPGEPPTVVTTLGRPERRISKNMLCTHLLNAA